MAPYPSKAQALLNLRCPRCRRGMLFTHPPFDLRHFSSMPKYCPHCALKYEREPGFFWGAMYVSYAFTVALFAVISLILWHAAGNPPVWAYILAMAAGVAVTLPFQIRYSRTILLYFFASVRFDPAAHDAPPQEPPEEDEEEPGETFAAYHEPGAS